jgi:S-adenosylmethionine:tRNA ribosyltransferase-isomerase
MHLSDIDYDLPQNLIAQHPIEPRDAARLLVDIDLNDPASEPVHRHVSDFVEFVRPGDVVVVNHTRVMPARVILHRVSGGIVEALLLEEKDATTTVWESLLRPGGKLKVGEILYSSDDTEFLQVGERTEAGDTFLVRLLGGNVVDQLAKFGSMPLPPYITEVLHDAERYQTVFAHDQKSSAAPTAGLHFTDSVLEALQTRNIEIAKLTLHVGAGTFKPVKAERMADHAMHEERVIIGVDVIEQLAACKGRVMAVGTAPLALCIAPAR